MGLLPKEIDNVDDWAYYGWLRGWCSPPIAHEDGIPLTEEEEDELHFGGDIDAEIIRIYRDATEAQEVCENSPIAVVEAIYRGWDELDEPNIARGR
jgi:hypothetical protein